MTFVSFEPINKPIRQWTYEQLAATLRIGSGVWVIDPEHTAVQRLEVSNLCREWDGNTPYLEAYADGNVLLPPDRTYVSMDAAYEVVIQQARDNTHALEVEYLKVRQEEMSRGNSNTPTSG